MAALGNPHIRSDPPFLFPAVRVLLHNQLYELPGNQRDRWPRSPDRKRLLWTDILWPGCIHGHWSLYLSNTNDKIRVLILDCPATVRYHGRGSGYHRWRSLLENQGDVSCHGNHCHPLRGYLAYPTHGDNRFIQRPVPAAAKFRWF